MHGLTYQRDPITAAFQPKYYASPWKSQYFKPDQTVGKIEQLLMALAC